jgi:HIV Tat-specific factor 1
VVRKNTSVYITGIPKDATIDEVGDIFKKGGVILIDPITNKPKIKLYENENGLKGDGLVIYLREESVALACQLLDESPFRFGDKTLLKVQPAVFQEKKKKDHEDEPIVDKKIRQQAIQKLNK